MLKKNIAIAVGLAISFGACAKSSTTNWDSDIVENYLGAKKGSMIEKMSDVENNSRWYSTVRLYTGARATDEQRDELFLQGNLRLRGKTMLTDDIGIVGDFWLRAHEAYINKDGNTVSTFSGEWGGAGDAGDAIKWEQFRTGFESDKFGALVFAKFTATWTPFVTDIGVQGLNDTQGDAGGKNADKVVYKHQLDNNIFLNSSYDMRSEITGFDIGYQTADTYSYLQDSYGVYLSAHNGQPGLENGAGNFIIGNVDLASNIEADTGLNRHSDSQYTYSIAGYKQIGYKHRMAANIAYSDRTESVDAIKARGFTTGGLGLSATASYQMFADGFEGLSPVITVSHDEFGDTVAPEVKYYFKPNLVATLAHVINTDGADITKLEFQADF